MSVTLSVSQITKDILDAFKLETPELFGPAGFAKDFKSDTAVLGDKLTAKIAKLPKVADLDPTKGFKDGAQDVTELFEDVPVTLDQLKHVPVRIPYLTGLATKGVDLYKAAVANIASVLGKHVVDAVLAQAKAGAVSRQVLIPPQFGNLDGWEKLRDACNAQKMASSTRWALISSELASALGSDDRVRSAFFYNERNGEQGFRVWKELAGFSWVREYPDAAGQGIGGVVGDHRLAAVSVRKIHDMESAAKSLGVPPVMKCYPVSDPESGLELTGISWQESGTGDLFVTVAILFGVGVGNQGGAPGSLTDDAGLLLISEM